MQIMIKSQRARDLLALPPLLDLCFGADRLARPSYALRRGRMPRHSLGLCAWNEKEGLCGSLQFWEIRVGARPALLLGPLAIRPQAQSLGIGRRLLRAGLQAARTEDWALCFLIGAPPFYAPFGFVAAAAQGYRFPEPVHPPQKFQLLALDPRRSVPPDMLAPRPQTALERQRRDFGL